MKRAGSETMKGVIGVIAKIYIGVIQNLVNISSTLCFLLVNRIIFNLLGLHIEKLMDDHHTEKCQKNENKVSRSKYFSFAPVTLSIFMG